MEIKIKMANTFEKYCINSIEKRKEIKATSIIKELLKNEKIKKAKNLALKNCSIADLKYNNKNIIGCKISSLFDLYNFNGYIILELK